MAWIADILQEVVPKPAAQRLADVCMMLLDGATVEAMLAQTTAKVE